MRSHVFTWKWKQLGAKNSFSKLIYFKMKFLQTVLILAKTCHLVMLPVPDSLAQKSHRDVTGFYFNFVTFIRLGLKNFRHLLHKHYCDYEIVCSVKCGKTSEFSL